jgi:hypothetical protein
MDSNELLVVMKKLNEAGLIGEVVKALLDITTPVRDQCPSCEHCYNSRGDHY